MLVLPQSQRLQDSVRKSFNYLEKEEDGLKGRVISVSLADLNNNAQEQNWRKIKL
jgi:ribosomal protein S3AE